MKTLLVFGGTGQLGSAISSAAQHDWKIATPSSVQVDLRDGEAVRQQILHARPGAIINAAAYTRVDDAEVDRETAFLVNAAAPAAMAAAATALGVPFLHVSTDYVFDGTGQQPYQIDAHTNPLNVYGESKRAGEISVRSACPDAAIVRTAWVHAGRGVNFIATAVRLLTAGTSMRVVDDQVGTPTRAAHLADALLHLLTRETVAGMYHYTDAGVASWYDVACCVHEALATAGRLPEGVTVTPVESSAYPRPARRPAISVLSTHASRNAAGWSQPYWRHGVVTSVQELLHA
ncbi:MAG: dTDP-4-dehydrorhamnose reductase [Gemmatimonadota bacterium]